VQSAEDELLSWLDEEPFDVASLPSPPCAPLGLDACRAEEAMLAAAEVAALPLKASIRLTIFRSAAAAPVVVPTASRQPSASVDDFIAANP
jgi:hypothetical protein